jgi:glycosyltransferase involved in cell wall biosynthesis
VVGTGPLARQLARQARGDVRFLGFVPQEDLREAYRRAAALLVPNVEDFGITAVEALGCGTPVVGLQSSGTADVVRPGVHGELASSSSEEALVEATGRALDRSFDSAALRQRALAFSRQRFGQRFRFLLDRLGFGKALE